MMPFMAEIKLFNGVISITIDTKSIQTGSVHEHLMLSDVRIMVLRFINYINLYRQFKKNNCSASHGDRGLPYHYDEIAYT